MIQRLPATILSQLTSQAYVDLQCSGLPLAVYREICAHLRQCLSINAELLAQSAATFRYSDSQAGGLRISGAPDIDQAIWQQVEAILQYYGTRYGAWELIDT
ncbi:MAG: hypothetical protein WBA10_18925 [Elainellaceae cyanobacterium]